MMRNPTQVSLSALIVMALSVVAVTSASAAELVGKWYGKLDSAPVIVIDKTGSEYSASLVDVDSTIQVRRPNDIHSYSQSTHKDLVSFEVAGNTLHFVIRNTINRNGDTDFARDDYNLTLSGDGHLLIGTVRRIALNTGNDFTNHSVPQTVTPITLFATDFATRSQP